MTINPDILLKRISNSTSFLFLGQSYRSICNNKDLFLQSISKKYLESEEVKNYDDLLEIDFSKERDDKLSWIFRLSEKLSGPKNFDKLAELPWSGIYTTAIDNLFIRLFENDWRKVHPIYNKDQISENPRSRYEINLSYLFGCISQVEKDKRIPTDKIEKSTRLNEINSWLDNFSELLTVRGTLFIDGYDPEEDWLGIDRFYTVLDSLEKGQAYFFSFKKSYLENAYVKSLIDKEKIIPVEDSFLQFYYKKSISLELDLTEIDADSVYGKWIKIGRDRERVPKEIKSRLIRSAIILDDSLILPDEIKTEEDRYTNFKKFLSFGSNEPYWPGYENGLAFERDFVGATAGLITEHMKSNAQFEKPIIIFGQSSSGKTIGLGHLAYFFSSKFGMPSLFIPRNYVNPNDVDLDYFCQWAEDKGANYSIIIWDGMIEDSAYFTLQNKLNARGRKVIVVGSIYKKGSTDFKYNVKNYIEADIELSAKELKSLKTYLTLNIPDSPFIADLINRAQDKNFLAILYRYLPETKFNIQRGLNTEINTFAEYIIENATKPKEAKPNTRIADLLLEAGLEVQIKDEKIEIDTDEYDTKDQFINYIIIPGKFGLSIPFDLLLRCIGAQIFQSSIFKELKKTNFIKWNEDKKGNIFLEPRTAIEAEILSKSLGSRQAQVEIIKQLIEHLRIGRKSPGISIYNDSVEINFAVDLLRNVGPNSSSNFSDENLLDIAESLGKVRKNLQAHHPRLVLQEASYYREVAKNDEAKSEDLLDLSEEILEEELDLIQKSGKSNLLTYFKVELASTLGTKVYKLLNSENVNKAEVLKYYKLAKREVFSSKEESPENYPALDVILWCTRDLIKSQVLNDDELLNIQADLLHIIDFVELEGIDENYKEKFLQRKLEIGDAIDENEVSQKAYDDLEKMGSTAGYYLIARSKLPKDYNLGSNELPTDEEFKGIRDSFSYLDSIFGKIQNDPKCIYLMFRLWWLLTARKPLFYREKMGLPLSRENWIECLRYTNLLKGLDRLYETPTLLYQEALAYFHLERYQESRSTFSLISAKSDNSSSVYGSKRIIKYHVASDAEGNFLTYTGEATQDIGRSDNRYKGNLFINEIRTTVPYILNDFRLKEVAKGRRFTDLVIAFNFRGPVAFPKDRLLD